MAEVILYVYDMTKSGSGKEALNFTVVQMNKLLKDGVSFGGMFHTAIQVYGNEEWAYGESKQGTGVFSCPAGKNPDYTLRERIVLGRTACSASKVNQILKELRESWAGKNYSNISRNSKHFCDEFLERLGAPTLPGWVNRFANVADGAKEAAGAVIKAKDAALKSVLHPVDFAFGNSSKSKPTKVRATPVEFNVNLNFFTDNFRVSAPVIRNDDDDHHANHEPVVHEPVVQTLVDKPPIHSTDNDEPVTHKDDKPVVIHTDEKPKPMHA